MFLLLLLIRNQKRFWRIFKLIFECFISQVFS